MLHTTPARATPAADAAGPSPAPDRPEPPVRDLPGGLVAVAAGVALWAYLVVKYLRQRIILSFDTANNYAHVWYVADRIWKHGHLPLHMPVLGAGRAFAFPYGFIPWVTAALFRPLLGDWVVGLWMVIGAAGLIGGTFFAFPELRRGWWAAAVLANPAIIEALLFGQLTFEWAGALVLFGIGCWRRDKRVAAVILAGAGQATHPAIVLPMTALLVAAWWWFEPDRRALVRCYLLSTLVALPATVIVFASPTASDATWRDIVVNFIATLAPRACIVVVPAVLTAIERHRHLLPRFQRAVAPFFLGLVVLVNVIVQIPLRVGTSWRWLHTQQAAASGMDEFLSAGHFQPGKTYRVLRNGDVKFGMYRLLQAGGKLDSEFFPESQAIHSFSSVAAYDRLLCARKVDYVVDFASYDQRIRTNEHALLSRMAGTTPTDPGAPVVVRSVSRSPDVELFSIERRSCPPSS